MALVRKTNSGISEPVKVNNRDILILQSVVHVMQDIRALEIRREWQRERMTNITHHLTGMPSSGTIPHGLDEAFASVAALEDDHKEKVKEYTRRLRAAERIIDEIDNKFLRTFVTMMYVENQPERTVRAELNMSEWGFRQARQAVEQAEDMGRVVWRERYTFYSDG